MGGEDDDVVLVDYDDSRAAAGGAASLGLDASFAVTRHTLIEPQPMKLQVWGLSRERRERITRQANEALERAYRSFGIEVAGNDVDPRWPASHPRGRWVVGDALAVSWDGFDAVVFAPPLSRGCTGRREDALRVGEVRPAYADFVRRLEREHALGVMVLPARALATRRDRDEFWELMAMVPHAQVVPLTAGRRRVVKYHDAYLERRRG